jgi:transcriptional regulator with XRE-family HTH domain
MPNESALLDENIGKRLKSRRLQLGLSQKSLAFVLGVSSEQVKRYETGNGRIEAARLQEIAKILKVPVLFFFRDTSIASLDERDNAASLNFLDTAYALRLMQAFKRIQDRQMRRSILELVEQLADKPGTEES